MNRNLAKDDNGEYWHTQSPWDCICKKKKTVVGQKFNVVTCNINYSSYHTTKIVMNCLRIQVIYISSPDEGLNDLEDIDPVADWEGQQQ